MIEVERRRFTSEKHAEAQRTNCKSNIPVEKRLCGQRRVFYPEDKPFLVPEGRANRRCRGRSGGGWRGETPEQTLISLGENMKHTIGLGHDNLGQQIAAIGYQAEVLEQDMSAPGSRRPRKLLRPSPDKRRVQSARCKEMARGLLPFELENLWLYSVSQALANRVAYVPIRSSLHIFIAQNYFVVKDNKIALTFIGLHRKRSVNCDTCVTAARIILLFRWAPAAATLYLSICDDGSGDLRY